MPFVGCMARQPRRSEPVMWNTSAGGGSCYFGNIGMHNMSNAPMPVAAPVQIGFCDSRAPLMPCSIGVENAGPTTITHAPKAGLYNNQGNTCAAQQWRFCTVGSGPLRDISNVSTNQHILPGIFEPKLMLPAPAAPASSVPVLPQLPAPTPRTSCVEPSSGGVAAGEDAEQAAEYVPDVVELLFRKEFDFMPNPTYMNVQPEVNAKMRAILIDWLVDVQVKFEMKQDTLFLTVNLIDRYLSRKSVPRNRLQLVGVVAMLVAAKFEELNPPNSDSLVYMTDKAYSKSDLFTTECNFLMTLGFEVLVPTASHFLDHAQRAAGCDDFHRELAQYILELSLLDIRFLRHQPSKLAAAALLLSNEFTGRSPSWPAATARAARHVRASLENVVEELRALLDGASRSSLQATFRKFSTKKRLFVATKIAGLR